VEKNVEPMPTVPFDDVAHDRQTQPGAELTVPLTLAVPNGLNNFGRSAAGCPAPNMVSPHLWQTMGADGGAANANPIDGDRGIAFLSTSPPVN
jgi:hypothetical protein